MPSEEEKDVLRMMYEPGVVLCLPKESVETNGREAYYLRGGSANATKERVSIRTAKRIIARPDVIQEKSANLITWRLKSSERRFPIWPPTGI